MPNHLSSEKSPYLLQHAGNPVDWYPWGEEAFRKARNEDKPIFLSIGYSTCHWCHVMEHESFEDPGVAEVLNEHAVCIKVDREERPDIDNVYMAVCQSLTGRGGWPLSIFMTSDGKPFYAGTYFPRHSRMGMPGFTDVIIQLSNLWKKDRGRIYQLSEQITASIQPKSGYQGAPALDMQTTAKAYHELRKNYDHTYGGFATAPKFPTPHNYSFLLRWHRRNPSSEALSMVEKSLDAMRNGGIFDQIGYGFHRYSVDQRWLVPHFEKMLYDQAMLAISYTEAYLVTGRTRYAQVSREIFEYVLRDMTDPQGGFYSAEDADSEGEEGVFYVWTPEEVIDILGEEDGGIFCRFFDISEGGNFEGNKSIPHITKPLDVFSKLVGMNIDQLEALLYDARRKLFAVREKRIHPLKDDKILTSWNGLMIAALAKGYQALGDRAYLDAASKAADFVLRVLRHNSGRLLRRYRDGEAAYPGYLEDYAFFCWGLIELYESSFSVRYLEEALIITKQMLDLFRDDRNGGFYFSADDNESLIARDKQVYDGAVPSGNSVAMLNLLRLSRITGNSEWEEKADLMLRSFAGVVGDYPSGYTQFLNAVDFALGPNREIVIAGEPEHESTLAMLRVLYGKFQPNRVLMLKNGGEAGERLAALAAHVKDIEPLESKSTVYICENYACKMPITELAVLEAAVV
ncbi:MAG: thioredoxin domain-containing protein [Syntrophobacteraceae bacterium]